MKKLALAILTLSCLFFSPSYADQSIHKIAHTETRQTTVYITKTGSKYHSGDCSYLRQSKIKTTKKEAEANRYTACSRCKP
jgi:hypothetical protein